MEADSSQSSNPVVKKDREPLKEFEKGTEKDYADNDILLMYVPENLREPSDPKFVMVSPNPKYNFPGNKLLFQLKCQFYCNADQSKDVLIPSIEPFPQRRSNLNNFEAQGPSYGNIARPNIELALQPPNTATRSQYWPTGCPSRGARNVFRGQNARGRFNRPWNRRRFNRNRGYKCGNNRSERPST